MLKTDLIIIQALAPKYILWLNYTIVLIFINASGNKHLEVVKRQE